MRVIGPLQVPWHYIDPSSAFAVQLRPLFGLETYGVPMWRLPPGAAAALDRPSVTS